MLSVALMLLGCMRVSATELEVVQKGMVFETVKDTKLLEIPETSAETVIVLKAGTPVLVEEEGQNGWCKVSSQEQMGYIMISELKTIGNQEELDAEFAKISDTVQLAFDEIVTREQEELQARIWGTIIVVLIIAIFGVSIVSGLRKNKLENEKENS